MDAHDDAAAAVGGREGGAEGASAALSVQDFISMTGLTVQTLCAVFAPIGHVRQLRVLMADRIGAEIDAEDAAASSGAEGESNSNSNSEADDMELRATRQLFLGLTDDRTCVTVPAFADALAGLGPAWEMEETREARYAIACEIDTSLDGTVTDVEFCEYAATILHAIDAVEPLDRGDAALSLSEEGRETLRYSAELLRGEGGSVFDLLLGPGAAAEAKQKQTARHVQGLEGPVVHRGAQVPRSMALALLQVLNLRVNQPRGEGTPVPSGAGGNKNGSTNKAFTAEEVFQVLNGVVRLEDVKSDIADIEAKIVQCQSQLTETKQWLHFVQELSASLGQPQSQPQSRPQSQPPTATTTNPSPPRPPPPPPAGAFASAEGSRRSAQRVAATQPPASGSRFSSRIFQSATSTPRGPNHTLNKPRFTHNTISTVGSIHTPMNHSLAELQMYFDNSATMNRFMLSSPRDSDSSSRTDYIQGLKRMRTIIRHPKRTPHRNAQRRQLDPETMSLRRREVTREVPRSRVLTSEQLKFTRRSIEMFEGSSGPASSRSTSLSLR